MRNEILILIFYLGETLYVVRYDKIREVCPMVMLKKVPNAPAYFSGYFNYRGSLVPVFDLRQLLQEQACRLRLSTRILLVNYQPEGWPEPRIFGLIAERVTEAVKKPLDAFVQPGLSMEETSHLREFLMEGDDMLQCVDLDRLIEKFRFPLLIQKHGENLVDIPHEAELAD